MRVGVSSSCFYPACTEEAVRRLQEAGLGEIELFLNTFSELEPGYTAALQRQLAGQGTRVLSFHPFTSGMEPFFFATDYERRAADGRELYKRLFDCAARYGARIFTFHGDYKTTPYPFERYCENFAGLSALAREYGLLLCQENVVRCKCGSVDSVRRMRELLGREAHFTLDLKQALRSGADIYEMLEAMGEGLAHIHISDHAPGRDCLAPGCGNFDFRTFFRRLRRISYEGDVVIELYRNNFRDAEELAGSAAFLTKLSAERAAEE